MLTMPRRLWLITEYVLGFFGIVGAYAYAGSPGGPIPVLLLGGGLAFVWLRHQPDFVVADLIRASVARSAMPSILVLWTAAVVAGSAVVAALNPADLFDLPRAQPLLWLAIAVFYPLLSVYPQELIYRAFLMYRYAPVFGTGQRLIWASAAAFGFAHIIFGSIASVVLTLIGGWLFARRYQQTRSLLAASFEHALYGVAAFTIGLGDLFYQGPHR